MQTYRYTEVWCNRHAGALFETSVFKKVRILYSVFLQQHYNAANTTMLHLLNKIYFLIAIFYSFSLRMFDLNVPHFSL